MKVYRARLTLNPEPVVSVESHTLTIRRGPVTDDFGTEPGWWVSLPQGSTLAGTSVPGEEPSDVALFADAARHLAPEGWHVDRERAVADAVTMERSAELRRIRNRLGLSAEKYAAELGVRGGRQRVNEMESGRRPVPEPVLRLARTLGLEARS